MTDQSKPTGARRGSQLLSTVLFIAALGFAAAALYIWYLDDADSGEDPPPPTVENGVYGLVNVLDALKDAGIDADYGRSPATSTSNQLDMPGQNLRVVVAVAAPLDAHQGDRNTTELVATPLPA